MDDQQLLTPEQVADRLQLSIYTILDYLRHGHPRGGKLRGFKTGKQWRIREVDLQAFIEANLSNGERHRPVLVTPADSRPEPMHPAQYRATMLARLRAMQAEGLSLQKMADRLNSEGVPSLKGGRWHKGTIGAMLAQG